MYQQCRDEIKAIIFAHYKNSLNKSRLKNNEKDLINARAEEVIVNLEKNFIISEVKNIIIEDCRKALTKSSKKDKILDGALLISTTILTLILASISFNQAIIEKAILEAGSLVLSILVVVFIIIRKYY